eukprot:CAMPEP_0119515026 /NCGR_PEP_ID=MMETSP1344-20130328/32658_1 /TAXON_ID=236787 /ORGANISM="Florenciella parvula, Strain CCMP2471" /LENGTH=156 /DNA_ID=CAMNT_0007552393 /DNA_START=20 /DNA_END=490 /DNA_ORIENTATION=+
MTVSWANLQRGFWFNGFMNTVGLLIFNQCFTSKLITPTYPELFSTEGMLTIMLWGGAYVAASPSLKPGRQKQPYTYAVFFVEKVFYTASHVLWCTRQAGSPLDTLTALAAQEPMTALFYAGYGLNDLLGAFCFGAATIKALGEPHRRAGAFVDKNM